MIEIRLKIDNWKKRFAAIEAQRAAHRRTITILRAEKFVGLLARLARRDTNRYVRGWLQAGKSAGLSVGPLPPLQASKRRDKYLEKLDAQVVLWRGIVARKSGILTAWYTSKGRKLDSYGRKLASEIGQAEKRAMRAEEELRKFITASTSAVLFFDAGAYVERFNKRKLSTVRDKIYGGSGRVIDSPFGTKIALHNKEPHSTILERRFRTVATAKMGMGGDLSVVRGSYRRVLARGTS